MPMKNGNVLYSGSVVSCHPNMSLFHIVNADCGGRAAALVPQGEIMFVTRIAFHTRNPEPLKEVGIRFDPAK